MSCTMYNSGACTVPATIAMGIDCCVLSKCKVHCAACTFNAQCAQCVRSVHTNGAKEEVKRLERPPELDFELFQ